MTITLLDTFSPPPTDGSLALSALADYNMENNAEHDFAVLVDPSENGGSPLIHVNYRHLGLAVHRVAHLVNPQAALPHGTKVAILTSTDTIVNIALVLGTMRAGLVPTPAPIMRLSVAAPPFLIYLTVFYREPNKVNTVSILSLFRVPIRAAYGSTELGAPVIFELAQRAPEDWVYVEFPDYTRFELIAQNDEDGTFELVMMCTPRHAPFMINYHTNGESGYATKDLVLPHPTKHGLLKLYVVPSPSLTSKTETIKLYSQMAKKPIPYRWV
ncbi:hypothetical protein FRC10_009775 [Ceratobasidium sp. 414]|nr:hypothetical protein FRC10_009775 [Ceratobasidium sp. 414]